MRFRPGHAGRDRRARRGRASSSSIPAAGAPARRYGTTDPVSVPTVRTALNGDRLQVRSTGPVTVTEHPDGESALVAHGDALAALVPRRTPTADGVVLVVPLLRGGHCR